MDASKALRRSLTVLCQRLDKARGEEVLPLAMEIRRTAAVLARFEVPLPPPTFEAQDGLTMPSEEGTYDEAPPRRPSEVATRTHRPVTSASIPGPPPRPIAGTYIDPQPGDEETFELIQRTDAEGIPDRIAKLERRTYQTLPAVHSRHPKGKGPDQGGRR